MLVRRPSRSVEISRPLARDPALVADDVAQRYLSPARALEWYGVVAGASGRVDADATARERRQRRSGGPLTIAPGPATVAP